MKGEANDRLLMLSTPKPRNEGQFRGPEWEVRLHVHVYYKRIER